MSYDDMSIKELEINILAINTIELAFPGCTIGELRSLMAIDNSTLHQKLRRRDIKEINECLANIPEPIFGLFDHITADSVKLRWRETGEGLAVCKREMHREAIIAHLNSSDDLDLRTILRWLVERVG